MSDVAYIMETQDPQELWLVDGENRFRVSRDMYMLLASNGADLPPTYDIADVMEENAKLRETLKGLMMGTYTEMCADRSEPDCKGCSMHHGEDGCTVVDAMEMLGIDMYGEQLRIEVMQ